MKRGPCRGRFNATNLFDRGGEARCAALAVQRAVFGAPRSLCRVIPHLHLLQVVIDTRLASPITPRRNRVSVDAIQAREAVPYACSPNSCPQKRAPVQQQLFAGRANCRGRPSPARESRAGTVSCVVGVVDRVRRCCGCGSERGECERKSRTKRAGDARCREIQDQEEHTREIGSRIPAGAMACGVHRGHRRVLSGVRGAAREDLPCGQRAVGVVDNAPASGQPRRRRQKPRPTGAVARLRPAGAVLLPDAEPLVYGAAVRVVPAASADQVV
eukprot:ctg_1376.g499